MATHASDADPSPSRATTPGTKFAPMSAYSSVDPDFRVCADCFGDDGLKDFVRGHADATQCSFCGAAAREDIAAPLGEVIDHMLLCLARDYNNPMTPAWSTNPQRAVTKERFGTPTILCWTNLGSNCQMTMTTHCSMRSARGSEASSGAHGTSIRLDPMRRSHL